MGRSATLTNDRCNVFRRLLRLQLRHLFLCRSWWAALSLFLLCADNNFSDTRFYFWVKEWVVEIMGTPRSRIV